MDVDECYQELGLDPGASDAEVKAAWRRLAARWHPDRNASPEAPRRIQRINQALEAIRRARQEAAVDADGAALDHAIELTIEDVVLGCTRDLHGEVVEACADCDGSGQQLQATACPECGGSGRVPQALWVAWLSPTVECRACQGSGSTRPACAACGASGQVRRPWHARVQVPAGLRPGTVLDAIAQVQGGREGGRLALRVHWTLQPHDLFTVGDGGTLHCELPVDGFAWMANRWIDVPTPRGVQQMRLQRGVLAYRIRQAGLPWQEDGARADALVTVTPLFPDALTPEQEACIEQLVSSNTGAHATAAGERMTEWAARLAGWQAQADAARPR